MSTTKQLPDITTRAATNISLKTTAMTTTKVGRRSRGSK